MAEFANINAKNMSIGYMLFELNCNYHPHLFYKKDIDLRSKLKSVDKLLIEFQELMTIYNKNLDHTQKL